jgi:radical SAM-linked protein
LPTEASSPTTRIRLRFRKDGDLRFISHHDLMRLFERLLRRTALPLKFSEGFHPKPRLRFPSALSLGIVGRAEALEIDFVGALDPDEVLRRLAALAPEGLTLLGAKVLPLTITGQPVGAEYLLPLPSPGPRGLAERLEALLAQPKLCIHRARLRSVSRPGEDALGEERLDAPHTASGGKRPPPPGGKPVDLRPYLQHLELTPKGLLMQFHVTPQGTARPEEILRLLGLDELLSAGDAVLERTRLALADETEPLAAPVRAVVQRTPAPALAQKA